MDYLFGLFAPMMKILIGWFFALGASLMENVHVGVHPPRTQLKLGIHGCNWKERLTMAKRLDQSLSVVDGALTFKLRLAHFGDMAYVKGASLDAHPGLQAGVRVYVRKILDEGRTAYVFDETDGEYVVDTTDLEILSSHFYTLETPPEPYQPT